jgi:hypothetical protein
VKKIKSLAPAENGTPAVRPVTIPSSPIIILHGVVTNKAITRITADEKIPNLIQVYEYVLT